MTDPHLTYETRDGVAEIVLSRPDKRNAITGAMWRLLTDSLALASADARVLIITGVGGSFSAGADLVDVRGPDGRESPEYRILAETGLRAVREIPIPTLAAVDGHCIGAGALLALACDIRVSSPRSSFSIPAVRYGFHVEAEGLARLVRLVGPGHAARLLLPATSFDGHEAMCMGLVEVCAENSLDAARHLAAALTLGDPPALAATLQAIRNAAREP